MDLNLGISSMEIGMFPRVASTLIVEVVVLLLELAVLLS